MKCNYCKQEKPDKEFALFKGNRREVCKDCSRKTQAYYTHPESYFNLFVGKESWKHIYFNKTK